MKPFPFGSLQQLLFTLLLSFLFNTQASYGSIIYSKQSGAWSTASTWEGNTLPLVNDYVIIKTGHTVTHTGAFIRNGNLDVRGTLVLPTNVARTFTALCAVEISGELRMESGSIGFDGQVYGAGLYRQMGGVSQFTANYYVSSTDLQGGTATFNSTNSIHFGYLVLKNATLDNAGGQGEFTVGTEFSWLDNGYVALNTNLIIQEGAFLQFAANATFKNDGLVRNYGTAHSTNGTLTGVSLNLNFMFNYGLWEIDVPAGKTFSVTKQFIDSKPGGTILKKGSGALNFTSTGSFQTLFGNNTFHVQAGSCTMHVPELYPHNGTWQVDAGATLNFDILATTDIVKFNGSTFINNGEVKGAATLQFWGDTNTTLEGGGKYTKVEINKTGGADVILYAGPEITGILTLTSGLIVLNQYNLRLGTATVNGSSALSYIKTNGLGTCIRYCPNTNAFVLFPVGKNRYAPFGINVQVGSQADYFKVRTTDAFHGEYQGTGFNHICSEQIPVGVVSQLWEVTENVAGGSTARTTAGWIADAEQGNFNRNNCTVGRYYNGDWHANGFGAATQTSAYFQDGIQTTFGLFGVYDAAHLADVNFVAPVPSASTPLCEWNDLYLQSNAGANVDIHWSGPNGYQSNAQNPVVTGIQLSQEGIYTMTSSQYGCPEEQTTVSVQVDAEPTPIIYGPNHIQPGTSANLLVEGGTSYHWSTGATTKTITVSPSQTTDYQVTVSNAAGCTNTAIHTVEVLITTATTENAGAIQQMKLAPNPTTESTVLTFASMDAGEAQLSVTDMRGLQLLRQKMTITSGLNQINIPLVNIPAGTYLVTLIKENELKTTRVVKCD